MIFNLPSRKQRFQISSCFKRRSKISRLFHIHSAPRTKLPEKPNTNDICSEYQDNSHEKCFIFQLLSTHSYVKSRFWLQKKILFPAWFSRQEKGCCVLPKKLLAIMKISTTQGKKCSFLRGNPRTTLPSSDNIFLSYDLSNPFCRKPLKQYNLQRFIYNLVGI